MRKLLFPDPAEGAGESSDQRTESTEAAAAPPAPPKPPAPPAGTTVANGEVTEEVLLLRQQLADKDKTIKDRETEIATAKDTHERYRQTVEAGTTIPIKPGKAETKRRVIFLRRA